MNNKDTLLLPAPSRYHTEMALYKESYPLVKDIGLVKEVGVYQISKDCKFQLVDSMEISGIAAIVPKAFVIRSWIDDTDEGTIEAASREAEKRVKKRLPGHRTLPSHPTWVKRNMIGSYYSYDLYGEVDVPEEPNLANSRLTRLISHIDDQSRYLGRARVAVLRGEHEWATWDGWCLLNPNKYHVPWNHLKVYGTDKFGIQYLFGGSPTVKCCSELNPRLWRKACKHLGIGLDDVDVIIPEISLKFDNGKDGVIEDVELFSVFDSVLGERFTVSLQMLMNVPLTNEAHEWAAARMIPRIEEINEALKDPSGLKALALIASDKEEMRSQLAAGELSDVEAEEGTESMSALQRRILAGLPIEEYKYLQGILEILLRRLRNFRIPGASEMVLPDGNLNPYEITISRRVWKHMKRKYGIDLKVGDWVVIARHPVTGTEVALVKIVAIGSRTAVNPTWWAERFSGDFDGDRIAIGSLAKEGISTLVDEDSFTYPPKSEKVKTKVPMTIHQANAKGKWSQATIPEIDTYLRICNEKGLDAGPMKNLLQWTIDSAKNHIDFDIHETCIEVGLAPRDRLSALASLMSARLGGNKNNIPMVVNGLIRRAVKERTRIKWMNIVRDSGVLCQIVASTGDSVYAGLCNKVSRGEANGYEKFLALEMRKSLIEAGLSHLTNAADNMVPNAIYPYEDLDQDRVGTIRERALQFPGEAKSLAKAILSKYGEFLDELRASRGTTTKAYRRIREANDLIHASEHGDTALKYLFAAVCLGADKSIRMRATTILGYFPVQHGTYSIVKINEYLGYNRPLNIHVIPAKGK